MRAVLGALAGYLLSASCCILWFRLTGHPPHAPAPAPFVALTTVFGIAIALAAGYLAARIGSYNAGFAVAVITFVAALLSSLFSPGQPHWSQVIALVAMCPATVLGARFGRRGGF